jgi:NADP-dependent 3-hydroxy acid dehydrogenase YdfG
MYRIALISGASSGIGKAIAGVLAERGVKLILLARREDRLRALADSLQSKTSCHVLACDLTNENEVARKIKNLPPEFSEVDVLINCAGAALGLQAAQEADWSNWKTMIELNCLALANLTHVFLPAMVKRNRGHIVNIGSIAGNYPYKGGNVYAATKAFVEKFTINLKADLLGTAVRVTNIEPGMVADTEFSAVRFNGDMERVAQTYRGIDALQAVDIANAVEWVLNQPAHVNINRIEIMPVAQAPSRTEYFRSI